MLFAADRNCVAVECGDTSTTLVVDMRSGFCLTLQGEEYFGDSIWDEVPVRFTMVRNLSGYLPEWFMKPLQEAWELSYRSSEHAHLGEDIAEDALYSLAHSIADYDPTSWGQWMKCYSEEVAPALV